MQIFLKDKISSIIMSTSRLVFFWWRKKNILASFWTFHFFSTVFLVHKTLKAHVSFFSCCCYTFEGRTPTAKKIWFKRVDWLVMTIMFGWASIHCKTVIYKKTDCIGMCSTERILHFADKFFFRGGGCFGVYWNG